MRRAIVLLTAPALAAGLSACATGAKNYPSLAKRDAERIEGTAEPTDAGDSLPPAPPQSADLQQDLASLVASARTAHASFQAKTGSVERAVAAARGAPRASEGWTVAQVALAGLEATRSNAMISVARLDELYAVERIANPDAPTPSALAIESARDEVDAWIAVENRTIDSLRARLGN